MLKGQLAMKRSLLRLSTNRNWIKLIINISSRLTKTLILSQEARILSRKNYKSNKDSMTTIRFTVSFHSIYTHYSSNSTNGGKDCINLNT